MSASDLLDALVKLWKGKLSHKIALLLIGFGAAGVVGSVSTVFVTAILKEYFQITIDETPVWYSLSIMVLGFLIAGPELYRELKHPPHPHDIELLDRFRNLIDARTRRFMRDRPFYEPMHRYPIERLEQFNHEWQGAMFEFRDPEVQTANSELYRSVDVFLNDFANAVWTMDQMPDFYTVKTHEDQLLDQFSPETVQKVERMLELARAVDDLIDSFERVAIGRLG